jgi:hypothetical protein
MNIDTPVVSYVVGGALFLKSKTASLCGLAVIIQPGASFEMPDLSLS